MKPAPHTNALPVTPGRALPNLPHLLDGVTPSTTPAGSPAHPLERIQMTSYAFSPALIGAHQHLQAEMDRAKRIRTKIDEVAQNIPQLEADAADAAEKVGTCRAECSVGRAASLLGNDAPSKSADAALKAALKADEAARTALDHERETLTALERMAPDADCQVREAGQMLQIEVSGWNSQAKLALSTELEIAVRPLLRVMRKMGAVAIGRDVEVRDAMLVAYLARPVNLRRPFGSMNHPTSENLLELPADAEGELAADVIAQQIRPVMADLAAAQSWPDYVPLSKRPAPYQIKGYSMMGRAADERRLAGMEGARHG